MLNIIAEIGINHNGDMDVCKKLINVAKEAGCDAVKFQKRTIHKVYPKSILDALRESPWGKTQREQKEGLEFGLDEYKEIDRYCKELSIKWFASAWDIESQTFLRNFDCEFNKVASAMIISEEFLDEVSKEQKHTFISTGMSNLENIERAVDIFRSNKCPFELMHTVSTYPMNDKDANLLCIPMLRQKYKCDVGYSGHESGLAISYAAVALGATSLERHITLNRSMYGSDQSASVEPAGLKQLVGAARKIYNALGNGVKTITKEEEKMAQKLRVHL